MPLRFSADFQADAIIADAAIFIIFFALSRYCHCPPAPCPDFCQRRRFRLFRHDAATISYAADAAMP
jgi:hypothetical protein